MIRRKLIAAPALLLLVMLLVAGAASGDSILTSPSQIVQVVSPEGNNGSFLISNMLKVQANGQLEPIPATMPENEVFIVTWISGYFIAATPGLNVSTTFNLGDYYRMSPQLTDSYGNFAESISPGVPITGLNPKVYLHLASDQTKTAITGVLNLRVMGYLAKIN
jgi:hypothetical protein